MTRMQLSEILRGKDWRTLAANAFGGQGSMGNGGAMRAAPLGAFFSDDLDQVVHQAELSAGVTHTHTEGIAGTIAVAIAAAAAANMARSGNPSATRLFQAVLDHTPDSKVRRGIALAVEVPPDMDLRTVTKTLGNGSLVTAPDTVPFAIWAAAHHLNRFVDGLALTVSAGGDCDTNAAIFGGIVASACGPQGLPTEWRNATERLA